MTGTNQDNTFSVTGLTEEQAEDLQFSIEAVPIDVLPPQIESQKMGDLLVGALIFVASLSTIIAILDWVQAQDEDIILKFEFSKFLKLEVTKKTTIKEIKEAAEDKGIALH